MKTVNSVSQCSVACPTHPIFKSTWSVSCVTQGMWVRGGDAEEHLALRAGTLSTWLWCNQPPAPSSTCHMSTLAPLSWGGRVAGELTGDTSLLEEEGSHSAPWCREEWSIRNDCSFCKPDPLSMFFSPFVTTLAFTEADESRVQSVLPMDVSVHWKKELMDSVPRNGGGSGAADILLTSNSSTSPRIFPALRSQMDF